ncbi:MAG: extracellular solute-binding protein [Hyphomicrobiales bacterium]|nr:extracellular solute-binding protein [Hyphomicrobiales bacterium]
MIKRLRPSLKLVSLFCALIMLPAGVEAADKAHGHSLIGSVKYPADFKHFDYVNPDAPKGGSVRLTGLGTFDSLNIIPSTKGNRARAVGFIYDTLMTSSSDEIATQYGLLAEWMTHPDDYSSVTYKLREEARWHDGKPVTPEDVIFSMAAVKQHDPLYAAYYKNVVKVEKTGDHEITFSFDQTGNRELPHIVGQLPIVPKHFYNDERPVGESWLEVPLGSGPYRVLQFEAGRYVTLERVDDYWGKDLPVNVGKNNMDQIRYDYYRDMTIAFEAFKAGKTDYYNDRSANHWSTAYDFPAVRSGEIIKNGDIELEGAHPMQGYVLNLRRAKFADPRVRQAFNLLFNFEWLNKNLSYGLNRRVSSYFENTELAATGLPQGKELDILDSIRDQVPPEVFTTEYKNPVNPENRLVDRKNLRQAIKLMKEAGWEIKDQILTNVKTGTPFTIEFLSYSPASTKIAEPYSQALEKLGITAKIRVVDAAQYVKRRDTFDFDIITDVFPQSESPGNEQRDFWGSQAADTQGSRNRIGIKNPAVDKLIDIIIGAKDREELVAASRALDRVLLWNHYLIPQFYAPNERIAYWNKYSHPDPLPARTVGFPTVWWYDADKAAALSGN